MSQHWEIVNNGQVVVSDTPEELWDNFCSYFFWCDNNPIEVKRTILSGNKANQQANDQKIRPYTVKGLCIHCGILEEYLISVLETKDERSLYYQVVNKARYIIQVQNMEMAMIGEFNPIFTSKVLNMDKEESPNNAVRVIIEQGLPALAISENEIMEKLDSENEDLKNTKEKNDQRENDTPAAL